MSVNKERILEFNDPIDTEDLIEEPMPRTKSIIALRMESLIKEQLKKDIKDRKKKICMDRFKVISLIKTNNGIFHKR